LLGTCEFVFGNHHRPANPQLRLADLLDADGGVNKRLWQIQPALGVGCPRFGVHGPVVMQSKIQHKAG
jgi:hypothetical protein